MGLDKQLMLTFVVQPETFAAATVRPKLNVKVVWVHGVTVISSLATQSDAPQLIIEVK